MTFNGLLVLVTLAGLLLRRVLYGIFERGPGNDSFLWFMLDPRLKGDPRASWPPALFILVAGGIGAFTLD